MIQVPLSECCDYRSPCMIARSKKKIPQISEGIFGLLIQSVFSPGRRKFDYASLDRFVNILGLGIKNTKKYFWVYDDYIYISDENIEYLDILAYFDKDFNPSDFSSCNKGEDTSCMNPLDKEFKIPSYLEKQVVDLVNEILSKTYFQRDIDITSNKKDEQNPNRKQ